MRNRFMAATIASSLWLTGCDFLTVSNPPLPRGSADLRVMPEIVSGGYRSQAIVKAYTPEDIDHLMLKLFRLEGGTETPVLGTDNKPVAQAISAAELGAPVTFKALLPGTTYRIRAYAYKAPGEDPQHLISTVGADSYTDVTLTQDDRPISASLKVRLADVLFNGMATASGIVVMPGGYATNRGVDIQLGPLTDFVPPNDPFWAEYSPTPVAGMKLVYEGWHTYQGQTMTSTTTLEVLSVLGNSVTYRYEMGAEGMPPSGGTMPSDMREYHGYPETRGGTYVRVGTEPVTVPLGTYPEAVKLVQRDSLEESTIWMVKGLGRVKELRTPTSSSSMSPPNGMALKQLLMP
ncbi:hypothetical protein D3C87_911820 [compost metagenome]